MKQSIAAFAAPLLAVGLSQAAVFTLPSSMAKGLNPVATTFGQGRVSGFMNTLLSPPS